MCCTPIVTSRSASATTLQGTGLILPLHICNVFAVYATAGAANAMATAARPAILPLTMLVLVHWLDLSDWVAGPLE